jgi:2-alkenal reductase
MSLRRLAVIATAATTALAAPGCGGDGGDESSDEPRTVQRTKVEVVEGLGRKGSFNPAAIYDKFSNGVVTVTSLFGDSKSLEDLFDGDGQAGQGSGFVLDEKGFIATNAHVVTQGQGKNIDRARQVFAQFADGNQVPAKIVGFDPNSDVGLIKVDPRGLELVPLELAGAGDVRVGEPVAAIGSPFGEEQSLSIGVVSAADRTIEALTQFQISDAIQTDAAINRGNSGGPLLNARGEVIGINSQIRSSGGGNEGVGFAVSMRTVRRSLDQLRSDGKARYGFVGISSQALYPQLARRLDLPVKEGALVAEVVEGGPADKAGIKGGGKEIRFQTTLVKPGGDVITKVNGRAVTRRQDLGELVGRYQPGEVITLELYRGDERRIVRVELRDRPDNLPS